ncbi:MAG: pyroglutamyl-peptidase I [Pseudomonadota bacterium]
MTLPAKRLACPSRVPSHPAKSIRSSRRIGSRSRRPVLVTGFDPFGGDSVNPSWEAVRRLRGWTCELRPVIARRLPVVFGEATRVLEKAVRALDPELVVCLGMAQGIPHLALERVALNLLDARIPDNAGEQPIDQPSIPGAPAAYFTGLPVKPMLDALLEAGIPAALSHSAGTFVCNHVFFALMHQIAVENRTCRGGFVHVPILPEQAAKLKGQPSLALDTLVQGVRVAIRAALVG